MAESTPPDGDKAPARPVAKPRTVEMRTRKGEVLDLSAQNLGVITEKGAVYSGDDIDRVLMIARKAGVHVTRKDK